jgi:hypothetical protein
MQVIKVCLSLKGEIMKSNKLKAYFWKDDEDAETDIAVIAENSKEARKIGSDYWSEKIGHDDPDWFINQSCKLNRDKEINIEGLKKGAVDDVKEGLKRKLYGFVEDNCEMCGKNTYLYNVTKDNKCICSDCEEKK